MCMRARVRLIIRPLVSCWETKRLRRLGVQEAGKIGFMIRYPGVPEFHWLGIWCLCVKLSPGRAAPACGNPRHTYSIFNAYHQPDA